jgi:phenylacetate-CoA ligase
LRAILTSGELLGDEERRYLEDTFACKVFDQYDLWEIVAFAPQCERGSYHVIPEISHVEILRNGCCCEPDQVGEIVGTHLANYSMPLIRYNIGDLASPVGFPCPCGRNTQTMVPIGGKGRDLIVTPKGYVGLQAGLVLARLVPPPPVEKLQFFQERKDEVVVRIVRGEEYAEGDTRRLIANVDKILNGTVQLRWEYVEDIPRTSSGKYPFVVSHVPQEL